MRSTSRATIPSMTAFALLVAGIQLGGSAAFAQEDGDEPGDYRVECPDDANSAADCRTDKATYIGWRTFNSTCSHCHGPDAVGSTIAPQLSDGMRGEDDYAQFEKIVLEGTSGQQGVMDGFANDPNVNDKIDQLYAYLKARIDGALPPGRPDRLDEE